MSLFALRFAWRDSRTARRRLLLASASIILGVAALVAVRSLGDNLHRAVDGQARTLLGADAVVTSRGAMTPASDAALAPLGAETVRELSMTTMVAFPTSNGETQFVTARGIDKAYPFFGDIDTVPAGAAKSLSDGKSALVERSILTRFGLKVGDPFTLGAKTFVIAAALEQIPGETMAFSALTPRIVVSRAALEETGLLAGPLVRHRAYLKFPDGADVAGLVEREKKGLRAQRLRIETVDDRREQLGRTIENIHAFLGLAGFIALFLGAIGVAGAVHAHIREKLATVAVLRCLGASSRQCFTAYLTQGVALGVVGAGLGAALGVAIQFAIPALFGDLLPVKLDAFFISWPAVGRGFGAGLGVCLLFTLLPLLPVRRVPPLRALRSAFEPAPARWDWAKGLVYALIAVAVVIFAFEQTGTRRGAVGFSGAILVMLLVPALIAKVLIVLTRRLTPRALPYVWRQGISNLHRPNNRTLQLMLSLGLGAGLLLTLALTRETLVAQILDTGGRGRPNLMLFDIQKDQVKPLETILAGEKTDVAASAPIVTMRLKSVKGRNVSGDAGDDTPSWSLSREYRSTYRNALADTEKVLQGAFDGRADPASGIVPVSLEVKIAKDLHVTLGDELVFDVQGELVTTRVTSIREVDWRRLAPNFFVVFPAGVLEEAPQTFVMAARTESPEASGRIQRAVGKAMPNVSSLDMDTVIKTLDKVFDRVESVVRFIAFFTFGTGAIVLAGAMLASRGQRVREIVLLRTLGASGSQLMRILVIEYAVLGLLGALTGAVLAIGANFALARFFFSANPAFPVGQIAGIVAGVALLAVATGLLSTRGVTRHPPLEVLRNE